MERLIGEHVYPEWDWKRGAYLADHVHVIEKLAEEKDDSVLDKPRTRRRIARVKRQFEALRPRRRIVRRQADGFDLDLDEVIRSHCDFLASGERSDRVYCAVRDDERDLAVSVLFDSSRSTESAVGGRPVIEIAREALVALIGGLDACGDAVSVHAFSSLRRDRVMLELVKDFDEDDGPVVHRRVMGLTPRFYTRLGAAIRHVARHLSERSAQRRLLLVLTDGKPNDLDHYEGRHGIEDTRRAVIEARRLGLAVFAVTVDAKAQDYVPYLFGQNGFAIVPEAEHLVEALPEMYRHVVA
jgi:nitric oxide reductase NorD protein